MPCCLLSWELWAQPTILFTFQLGTLLQGDSLTSHSVTGGKLKPLVQSQ